MATSLLINCGTKARFAIIQLSAKNSQAFTVPSLLHKNTDSTLLLRRNYSADDRSGSNDSQNGSNTQATPTQKSAAAKRASVKDVPDGEIKKSVFISQSYDIYTNLALEDWFYRNFDFTNHHVLMLWSNDPCVVVGRHQNPFLEANVSKLQKAGIALARRNSGGGTVYHDRGNMNMTFFTPRDRYNRNYNLNIVTRALFREWGIKAEISKRDDITLFDKKVRRKHM